ncbi:MAG: hypothetical protein ACRDIY_15440 [Chloroflexota bacterium]
MAWPFEGTGQTTRLVVACAIIVVSSLFIAYVTGFVHAPVAPLPPPTSPAAQVLSYAGPWLGPGADPLIVLPSGARVKASNYQGVPVDGTTYYYNLAPRASFDPLARGVVTTEEIEVVAVVGDAPNRVMIYTVKRNPGIAVPNAEGNAG